MINEGAVLDEKEDTLKKNVPLAPAANNVLLMSSLEHRRGMSGGTPCIRYAARTDNYTAHHPKHTMNHHAGR
jgi:hypothetical protein